MDKTRIADLNKLQNDLKTEKKPAVKKIISEAYDKVKSQANDNWLKSARETLTRESKKGNHENIKQVHEDIKKHEGKMGGTDNRSFRLEIPPERYREIFGHE